MAVVRELTKRDTDRRRAMGLGGTDPLLPRHQEGNDVYAGDSDDLGEQNLRLQVVLWHGVPRRYIQARIDELEQRIFGEDEECTES